MAEHKMRVFAVMRITDGLFSRGGFYPRWSQRGKLWTRPGDVKAHLTQLAGRVRYSDTNWDDIRVLEMELDPDLCAQYTPEEFATV